MFRSLFIALISLPLAVCAACQTPTPDAGAVADADFVSLLDVRPGVERRVAFGAWRGFGRADVPSGWRIADGMLSFWPSTPEKPTEGGDLITAATYANFELRLEWRISEGGNSGIFFHVAEEGQDAVWRTGPEMQVLDDERHHDGGNPLTSAGSNYALHAPAADVLRPVGQWNEARLVVQGAHVEHWLNGVQVVSYELWGEEWEALVAASKFASMSGYGRERSGHIALQDHGDRVDFRKIRIRSL